MKSEQAVQDPVKGVIIRGKHPVGGGLQMNNGTGITKPACNSSNQGMLWMTKGSTDAVEICASKGAFLAWYPLSF